MQKFLYVISSLTICLFLSTVYAQDTQHLVVSNARTLGNAVARELLDRGHSVTIFTDEVALAQKEFASCANLSIVYGTPQDNPDRLAQVMLGKTHIFYCPHYERYITWEKRLPQEVRALLTYVTSEQTIIFPSVFYVLGKQFTYSSENMIPQPCSAIGRAYRNAEQLFEAAARRGGCHSVVIRHSLPFGPHHVDGLTSTIFKNVLKGKTMEWVCRLDRPYQFCYAPDLVRCMIELGHKHSKPNTLVHLAGPVVSSIKDWMRDVAQVAGNKCRTTAYSRFLITVGSFFHADAATAKDILYSFEKLIALQGTQLAKELPQFKQTPMREAIAQSLEWFRTRS